MLAVEHDRADNDMPEHIVGLMASGHRHRESCLHCLSPEAATATMMLPPPFRESEIRRQAEGTSSRGSASSGPDSGPGRPASDTDG